MKTLHDYDILKENLTNDEEFKNALKIGGAIYVGTFNTLEDLTNKVADPLINDYGFVLSNNQRKTYIYNGSEWSEGPTIELDYLDPSDFCLNIPNSVGTIQQAEFNKLKNNLKAIKIYNEYTKSFYHLAYEDNNNYYFFHYNFETSIKQSLATLTINKSTGSYQTIIKYINIPNISDSEITIYKDAVEDNALNVRAIKQIITSNFSGSSGNFTSDQVTQLLNVEEDTSTTDQSINPLFVKLWDNVTGDVYNLVSKPINNTFGNWHFTNVRILGSTLNASIEIKRIVVNVSNESTATWTKITKNIS